MTYEEMILLIRGTASPDAIERRREEITELIPSLRVFSGESKGPEADRQWHRALNTLAALPANCRDDMLYLAAMLHNIGSTGTSSLPKQARRSAEIVRVSVLPALLAAGARISETEQQRLLYYIEHHADHLGMDARDIITCMGNVPRDTFRNLMLLEAADSAACRLDPILLRREEACRAVAGLLRSRRA